MTHAKYILFILHPQDILIAVLQENLTIRGSNKYIHNNKRILISLGGQVVEDVEYNSDLSTEWLFDV
jgi:hypothetical protein